LVKAVKNNKRADKLARVYLAALASRYPDPPPSEEEPNTAVDASVSTVPVAIRADVAAGAVLLARAVEGAHGLDRELRGGSPVLTIATNDVDIVHAIKTVAKVCLLAGRDFSTNQQTSGKRLACLMVRDGSEGVRIKEAGNATVADALHASATVVGIAPDPDQQLPSYLVRAADHRLSLGSLDASGIALVIEAVTGCAPTGGIDERVAAAVDLTELTLSIRPGRTADECVDGIRKLVSTTRTVLMTGPRLEDLVGYGEAKNWGLNFVADLNAWRGGSIVSFSEIESSLLIFGPPGVGKTRFSSALSFSARLPLLETSVAHWNSMQYLSGTLSEMRSVFTKARELTSKTEHSAAIVFVDELDGIGSKSEVQEYRLYYEQIINLALELFAQAPSNRIALICATNFPERIDSALLRSGRLDRKIGIGLPGTETLIGIFKHYLGNELEGVDLTATAARAAGHTGADVQLWVRAARSKARRAGRALNIDDLTDEISGGMPPAPEWLRRSGAVHEAGHLVAGIAVGMFEPAELFLNDNGGRARMVHHYASMQTKAGLEAYVVAVLAGRAAEESILGAEAVTVGSGAGKDSDLSIATSVALDLELTYGMGAMGLVRLDDSATQVMKHDPAVVKAVRLRLESCFARARSIVAANRETVVEIAAALERSGYLDRNAILRLLERHPIRFSERIAPIAGARTKDRSST
jgi:cell division protease FtsH